MFSALIAGVLHAPLARARSGTACRRLDSLSLPTHIAQWVERQTDNLMAAGSTPAVQPKASWKRFCLN